MSMKDRSNFKMKTDYSGSIGSSSNSSSSSSYDPLSNSKATAAGFQNLARSRSFGGLLISTRRGSNSASRPSGGVGGTWSAGVLGQGYGSPGVPRKLMNSLNTLTSSGGGSPFSGSGGVGPGSSMGSLRNLPGGGGGSGGAIIPKHPRPNKTRSAIVALSAGLQSCIRNAEDEMGQLKSSIHDLSIHTNQSQGRIYELEKFSKTSERYLKKVEYQLSRVEELGEHYGLQQKLREGVRAMAYAFSISEGKEKEHALANVKAGFKECTEVLCSLEAQLEMLLGNFKMQMKGIQGFARLCPGDVFEITIKHGHQKWKTRGKVGKDGSQMWELPRATFRAMLGEVMYIKAAEVKTLGKQVLLGNKFCEITELFSAHPQLMTVNLNPSGSLKLNVVVAWNPLDSMDEGGSIRYSSLSSSPSRKRRLSPTEIHFRHSSSKSPSPENVHNGGITDNSRASTIWERSLDSIEDTLNNTGSFRFSSLTGSKSARLYSESSDNEAGKSQRGSLSSDPSGNFTLGKKTLSGDEGEKEEQQNQLDLIDEDDHPMETEHQLDGLRSLKDTVMRLSSFLEDIQGQYPELEALEMHLASLDRMIQGAPCLGSSSSSLNIESALECFDFLDTVTVDESEQNSGSYSEVLHNNPIFLSSSRYHLHRSSNEIIDPKMTARTTDSGISSLGHGANSRSPSPTRSTTSPVQKVCSLVTGSNQLDLALETHINICLKLVFNLGSFGPLRCREKDAVGKLQQQGMILGSIINRAKSEAGSNGLSELASLPQLQILWERITENGSPMCTSADQAAHGLEEEIRPVVSFKFLNEKSLSSRVSRLLVQQILNAAQFNPSAPVTVFQFLMFLRPHEHSFNQLVEDLAEEEILQDRLLDKPNLSSVIKNLSHSLPPKNVLFTLVRLLLHEEPGVQTAVKEYFDDIACVAARKRQVIEAALEMLESESPVDRQSSCVCLGVLNSTEAAEELAYVAQTDEDVDVRASAKQTLLLVGEEGDRIYQQLTLSTHGFQGLAVN